MLDIVRYEYGGRMYTPDSVSRFVYTKRNKNPYGVRPTFIRGNSDALPSIKEHDKEIAEEVECVVDWELFPAKEDVVIYTHNKVYFLRITDMSINLVKHKNQPIKMCITGSAALTKSDITHIVESTLDAS